MSTRQYVCDALSKWSQHNLILLAILYLFSSTTHTDTLAQQPTAYWSFDEGQGSTLHDESGNGNDGTIYQAQWTDGISYAALDFDGVNDYVNIGNRLHNVNVPFSVTAWVNTRGTQQAQMIFDSDARSLSE
jgi:hypothetical protein